MRSKKSFPVVKSDIAESLIEAQREGRDWNAFEFVKSKIGENGLLELLTDAATRFVDGVEKGADQMLNQQAIMAEPVTTQLVLADSNGSEMIVETLTMIPVTTENGKSVKRPIDKVTAREYLAWCVQRHGVASAQQTLAARKLADAQTLHDALEVDERDQLLGEIFPELAAQLNRGTETAELEG